MLGVRLRGNESRDVRLVVVGEVRHQPPGFRWSILRPVSGLSCALGIYELLRVNRMLEMSPQVSHNFVRSRCQGGTNHVQIDRWDGGGQWLCPKD